MTARWTTDAECTRNRVGTLPTGYDRHHKRRFGFHGGVVVLVLAIGVFIGSLI
jgi:hypothetical protein